MSIDLTEKQVGSLDETFALLDRSGEGCVASKDLAILMRALGLSLSEDRLQEILQEIDPDERRRFYFAHLLEVMAEDMWDLIGEEEIWEAFREFDKNWNGYNEAKELMHVLTSLK